MATIPQHGDPTLEAMLKAIADNKTFEQRNYLGASEVGDPCPRKLWYNYNNYPKAKSEWAAVGSMAADSGYYAEDKTAERLRLLPFIELHTHMENGDQYGWEREIPLESGETGKMAGHFDGLIRGLIQAPKAIHIWEHKDKDQAKFVNFQTTKAKYGEKKALKEWDETYYGQAQMNMHMARLDGVQIDRHYLTVSYAGARKYDSCRTEYNAPYAERMYDRAVKILNAAHEPKKISEKSDYYLCRFCDFREECHG